ncbi:RidA family protein [Bacillus sp. GBSW19]|uniref:RidA family protein n=1 Tax=Bacillus TaxID=1386 RepID=UPI000D03CCE3|nr:MULTISPECIES: RidA family protein [unclassified Bacillus (in: firmicutes)]PRS57979.1 RidA family protein [Bacillus sp. GBSW19]PRS68046.1 RidA family protein [Bacillus sp. NMTD17]QZD58673.1 RidA family protein [Bacillus pumilus]WOP21049.1 RidA family protein [Bacillus pumilus]
MRTSRNPEAIHPPVAPYTHQIETTGPQRWLTLSGQVGMEVDGTIPASPMEQLELALENVKRNVEAADMKVEDITKLVFYLVGEFEAESRKRIMREFLGDHLPCMTMIYVVALASPALKVEVDAWACRDMD